MANRLAPIGEPFPEEIARLLETYPRRGGYLLSLFRTFANSARFLRKGVGNFLDKDSPLTLREREIVILRTTAKLDCEYEWGVHVAAFAKAAGLAEEQIAATRNAPSNADCWRPDEGLILRGVDELCDHGRVRSDTYDAWSHPHARAPARNPRAVRQLPHRLLCCEHGRAGTRTLWPGLPGTKLTRAARRPPRRPTGNSRRAWRAWRSSNLRPRPSSPGPRSTRQSRRSPAPNTRW